MDLPDRWASLTGSEPEAVACGADLLAAWDEPHRRYHDRRHLAAVLDALDVLDPPDGRSSPDVGDPAGGPPGPAGDPGGAAPPGTASWSARVAAWYHDAVYDPTRKDNEAESAIRAEADLRRLGYPPVVAADVARLVVLTADHRAGVADAGGALLCDADLAVLAGDADTYAAYVRAVRAEYAHVDDEAWRQGRSTVLLSLLDRPHLYATAAGRKRWEEVARANLAGEIAALAAGADPPQSRSS